jgi:hypothetical protein
MDRSLAGVTARTDPGPPSAREKNRFATAQLIIVYWNDIPAQVIAKRGRANGKAPADPALRAGHRPGGDEGQAAPKRPFSGWVAPRRSDGCGEDIEAVAAAAAATLEADYGDGRLQRLIDNGDRAPSDGEEGHT